MTCDQLYPIQCIFVLYSLFSFSKCLLCVCALVSFHAFNSMARKTRQDMNLFLTIYLTLLAKEKLFLTLMLDSRSHCLIFLLFCLNKKNERSKCLNSSAYLLRWVLAVSEPTFYFIWVSDRSKTCCCLPFTLHCKTFGSKNVKAQSSWSSLHDSPRV